MFTGDVAYGNTSATALLRGTGHRLQMLSGSGALRFRLPSEAEWEFACRALTTGPFSSGENLTTAQANYNGTQPYGSFPPGIKFDLSDGTFVATCATDEPGLGKFHGLARSLVANAVVGVTQGFKKELDIVGVGYRAELKGKQVQFALGYSHPVVFDIPKGIEVAIEKQTHITVTGVDRQLVGQVAANLRRLRKPDPYQQKGVRYTGEQLKKKQGKTGA